MATTNVLETTYFTSSMFNLGIKKHTHHATERTERCKVAYNCKGGMTINKAFIVENNHRDGNEIHVIMNNGTAWIFNERTHKFITVMILRPHKLECYYKAVGLTVPKEIVEHATENRKTVNKKFL